MNIQEMVIKQIKGCGGDGLVNDGEECGCSVASLAPCGNPSFEECVVAVQVSVPDGEQADEWYVPA